MVNYGIGLISPEILAHITHGSADITSDASIRSLSSLNLATMSLSVPGIALTLCLLPRKGVRWMQITGFMVTGFFCLLLGICFQPLQSHNEALFALYCMLCVAMSVGTSITTYTLPALLFDRDVRTTFNGISSAMGKVGAVIGSYSFGSIARSGPYGYTVVMLLCCAFSAIAAGLSIAFIDLPPPPPPSGLMPTPHHKHNPSPSKRKSNERGSEIEVGHVSNVLLLHSAATAPAWVQPGAKARESNTTTYGIS